jgi:hypothetical protein
MSTPPVAHAASTVSAIRKLLQFAGLERGAGHAAGPVASADELSAADFVAGADPILVLDWRCSPEHSRLIDRLSGGAVSGPVAVAAGTSELCWSQDVAGAFPETAGMRLSVPVSEQLLCFPRARLGAESPLEVLAEVDGQPWLLRLTENGGPIYILGIRNLPDIDMSSASEQDEVILLSMIVPILLYLRRHFGHECWRPGPLFANFIIDDPYLKPTYGCLNHERLARDVGSLGAAATIAFIPWNARRSRRQTVELYKRTPGLSLCLHGCDHTSGEFAETDTSRVRGSATAAVAGMRLHSTLTGLGFEPVMVFPQGKFSVEGMSALASAGVLAAINSHYLATNHRGMVSLRALLAPAVMSYGPCPLFLRRYPSELDLLRYDQVLGRPILLVQHHQYFGDGGESFVRGLERLQRLIPNLGWRATGEIARRVHLRRQASRSGFQVQFFCDQFVFEPGRTDAGRCEFMKVEAREETITAVTVNGAPAAFDVVNGHLKVFAKVAPGSTIDIAVERTDRIESAARRPVASAERVKVAVRRYLSDFRDDYVQTSSVLSACLAAVQRIR